MGIHIIAEFLGVDPQKISRVDSIRPILDRVVAGSGLKIVSSSYHQFEPHGVSAVYLLRESHLSVHTWPEHSYIALDLFSCGDEGQAMNAYAMLKKAFRPKLVRRCVLRRDLYERVRGVRGSEALRG